MAILIEVCEFDSHATTKIKLNNYAESKTKLHSRAYNNKCNCYSVTKFVFN